ncbi:glycoside hydrolase family 97 protein [Aeoliella sp. ICT_H6.2]|uniref:Glycoside hydrolase family 97 protein n=1 Tax=Aeoliella straminimaris TaxID=2954799 RepID=A0A9X2F782_9BACT|nr:glycoside hydrolase family 97 protein [Aeoliella straminimaris]MCO6043622.1 glycoside hydrolase family 97 protein [Aeoliella straminimaris]
MLKPCGEMMRNITTVDVRRWLLVWCLQLMAGLPACAEDTEPLTLTSPNGQLQVTFELDEQARPKLIVTKGDAELVQTTLGLELAESGTLAAGLEVTGTKCTSRDREYQIPVGKNSSARDRHEELVVALREQSDPHRELEIELRAFDDGVAFRYRIPQQPSLSDVVLLDELTTFQFRPAARAHLLPLKGYTTPYEAYYLTQGVTEVDPKKLFGVPMLVEDTTAGETEWVALTEADLTDYAGMYVAADQDSPGRFVAKLSPLPGRDDGAKVIGQAPFASPWRVLMVASDVGPLIESDIVFHLSSPSKIADTSWIQPGATTFTWWNHYTLEDVDFEPGVNTATMKHYIDFCAEHGLPYHTLDGLDVTWYGGPIAPIGPTDVTTAVDGLDLPEVLRYAAEKGVKLRLWVHWKALQPQLDKAFEAYEKWGIEGVMIDFMDRDDQEMVRWYHEVAEKAAQHHLTVTWHGAYKPTGMERTWPNVLSYEAALNQEYNKWSEVGTPPTHNLQIAFIRMLAGPLDYHQGGMRNVMPEQHRPNNRMPTVQGTRGHQLAMYVVYQNHLPMLVDYPEAYHGQAGFDFLAKVPTTWDETRVLHAEVDKCLVIARRSGDDWYLGGMTGDKACSLTLPLEFLAGDSHVAKLYLDDSASGLTSLQESEQVVDSTDSLPIAMPRGGGFVAKITPKTAEQE